MFERSEVLFKILCAGVGALVVWQAVHAIQRSDPLAGASIPALPSLPAATNTEAGARNTNAPPSQLAGKPATNALAEAPAAKPTNALAQGANPGTNASRQGTSAKGTNALAQRTNALAQATNALAQRTNALAQATNALAQGTNASATPAAGKARTNPPTGPQTARAMAKTGSLPGMPGLGPPLPPQIQARLDRIVESEVLGPVMRPQPMALIGILGRDVFLRAPNGQMGQIKEGDELGGVKLVKIGINRVLVEQEGEKKELTIFSGFGSETLLSKQTNNPQ